MAQTASTAELLGKIYALAGARDWDGVAECMHPDLVIHEAPSLPFGGTYEGKNALQVVAGAMYGQWPDAKVEIHDITGGTSWAVVILSLTFNSKKTGEPITQTLCEAGRFEDGLLIEHRIHYYDTAQIAEEA
ncbi:MAG: nuclear transport factor 2 family protein [Erythrobacter sp.]